MSNNILYLGTLNNAQLDFDTGNLTDISGFTGDIRNAVLTQSVTDGVTGYAPSANAIYDFTTGISGYLSENSNDTRYDLLVESGVENSNSSVITLRPEEGTNLDGDTDNNIILSGGQDILIDENTGLGLITITHSNTALEADSQYETSAGSVINGVGIDGRGHVTGFTTTGLDDRYYTEAEINTKLTNTGDWDTAYDRSVTGFNFNSEDGNLTLERQNSSDITISNLDVRYLKTGDPSLQYVTNIGNITNTGIEVKSIKIGIDGDSQISTRNGDLTLNSADGEVIVDGDFIVQGNATITGNLLVSGTTTTIESSVTTISDPIITLGSGTIQGDDQKDRGIEFIYYDGSIKTGFFGYDNEDKRFAFFTGATNTNENFSGVAAPLDLTATVDGSTIEYVDGSSYIQVKDGGITNAKLDNSSLTVLGGSGLTDNGNPISLGGTGTLNIGQGNGITVDADSISVDAYNGITVNTSGVSVTPSDGILVGAGGVSVTGHNGITVNESGVSTVSDQSHLDKIEIGADQTNVGSGTNTTYGGVKVVRARSISATPVNLSEDGTGTEAITIANDSTLSFEGVVSVRNEGTTTGGDHSAAWKVMGVLAQDSSSADMVLSQVTVIAKGANATAWNIELSAGDNGLVIQGIGEDLHNLVWSSTLNYNVITA